MKKSTEPQVKEQGSNAPARRTLRTGYVIIVVLIVVVGILAYPKIFNKDNFKTIRDADGKISVAIMPFQNMTGDTMWNIWQNGIQNELITKLSNSTGLSVRTYQTMNDILQSTKKTNYASITPELASDISRKLEASTLILGNIKVSGDIVRINTQLIDSKTEEIHETYEIDGNSEGDIFTITDSLSRLVKSHLEIKALGQNIAYDIRNLTNTNSTEAYKFFIQGMNLFIARKFTSSIEIFNKALEIDPNILAVYHYIIVANINLLKYEEAKQNLQKISEKIDYGTYYDQLTLNYWISWFDKDTYACLRYLELLIANDPMSRFLLYQQGINYNRIHQYEKAIQSFEKAFELSKRWGDVWKYSFQYYMAGYTYHELGNHGRENEIYDLGLSILPDHPLIIFRQAVCALSRGETNEASEFIEKYKLIQQTNGRGKDWINFRIGWIYQDAEQYDKAINIYSDLIVKNPQYPWTKNRLGYMLIDNDIDVNEGMELIERALEIQPDNSTFLATKGWGLYKQGQLEESLAILKESWDLRPSYNHDHYLHIQEVEKTLANQNK